MRTGAAGAADRLPWLSPAGDHAGDRKSGDAEQSLAAQDQTLSDDDQTNSTTDQAGADRDQFASDRDQDSSDRDHAAQRHSSAAQQNAYESTRLARMSESVERIAGGRSRARTSADRDRTAGRRDRVATAREKVATVRDRSEAIAVRSPLGARAQLLKEFDEFRAKAAKDRARAAADRERATRDRAAAARERARLQAELESAHLDGLTGAYRREIGALTLAHEMDRARRADGRFVLAFVDVDDLKVVNDRDGHAAGDQVLRVVADAIRTRLRSFDPIVRHGGDEFICGLGSVGIAEARRRFAAIEREIGSEAHVRISVGLAALALDETLDELTGRADSAMLRVKAEHHAGR